MLGTGGSEEGLGSSEYVNDQNLVLNEKGITPLACTLLLVRRFSIELARRPLCYTGLIVATR